MYWVVPVFGVTSAIWHAEDKLISLILCAAVYNFGGYKMGTTCSPKQQCWVTLYDKHLGDVTWFWWHQQVG